MLWSNRNSFSTKRIIRNLHKRIGWVELLTKLDDALQIVIEDVLVVNIKIWLTECFLITSHHHEDYFLILKRTFKEIREIALLLYLRSCFYHLIGTLYILVVVTVFVSVHLKYFSSIITYNYFLLRQLIILFPFSLIVFVIFVLIISIFTLRL